MRTETPVPPVRRLLAVCAHPYDATFALGGVIAAFAAAGTTVHIVCLTHARRADTTPRRRLDRARDLGAAVRTLGADDVTLLEHRPGTLAGAGLDELADEIADVAGGADALLVVAAAGGGSHPDHIRTLRAAQRAATRLGTVLYGWAPGPGGGRTGEDIVTVTADRERQRAAIASHTGLPADDPLRHRWLVHQSPDERLVVLRTERVRPAAGAGRA